jgi:Subtilase family
MTRGQAVRSIAPGLAGALLLLVAWAPPAGAVALPPGGVALPPGGAALPVGGAALPAGAVALPPGAVSPLASGARTAAQLQGAGARPAGCAAPTGPRVAHCYLTSQPAPVVAAARPRGCPARAQDGWAPCNLRSAYKITRLADIRGRGQTIAVVDAYNDPHASSDLDKYRSRFGLPACTAAGGCFRKVNQRGLKGGYPAGNMGWGQEISVDLDMVSAICPRCRILLVEADSNHFSSLFTAERRAIKLGAHVVSNSWGTGEFSGETSYDRVLDRPGLAITDSSGDGAYQGGVQYPSASPFVTSVGGTMLMPAANKRGWTEKTWVTPGSPPTQGSGSGCSAYEAKPAWQTDAGCARRTIVDVSAVAANVLGYDTFEIGGGGWYFFFGTSVSSPITAGMYGLAANAAAQTIAPAARAYAHREDLFDVTRGLATGICSPLYLCKAVKGYDGPTGLGTPKGAGAF